jgi:hypothetical protein
MICLADSGCWSSPEPVPQNPKVVLSELQAGHQMPTFAYARNNPIKYVDPTGLLSWLPEACLSDDGITWATWPGATFPDKTKCEDAPYLEKAAQTACSVDANNCVCKKFTITATAARFSCGVLPPTRKKPGNSCEAEQP